MDSTSIAFWRRPDHLLTIDYGQRSALGEIRAASQIATHLDLKHTIIVANCAAVGYGDLSTRPALDSSTPSSWWPCRNQLLVSLAVPWALANCIDTLWLGSVNSDDMHGDGQLPFFTAINNLLSVQHIQIQVEGPAINFTKAELVRHAGVPFEVLAMCHSCHTGEHACGFCRACNTHQTTMEELGFGAY